MRAFDGEVFDAVWSAVESLIPVPVDTHPKGGHRQRISDRVCFRGILIRLATGCSWVDTEALLEKTVSDTTLRSRRDEWIAAGVFDNLLEQARHAYDRIIGLDLSEVALDGSQHKAPCGGEGTGRNHTDRGKLGWKWSIITDAAGIPFGVATNGANRHDIALLVPTLSDAQRNGLIGDIETLHLDRGYDAAWVRQHVTDIGIGDLVADRKRKARAPGDGRVTPQRVPLGLRWPVERTNSWLTNYGQLRRNTDRHTNHRLAQIALAITIILTAKLIDWRNRWNPATPINPR